mgnify:CR=1 FL=1
MLSSLSVYAGLSEFAGLGSSQVDVSVFTDPWAVRSVTTQTAAVDPFASIGLGGYLKAASLTSGTEPFRAILSV